MAGCGVLSGLKWAPDRRCRRTHARLKQCKTVGLQFVQDRHATTNRIRNFSSGAKGPLGSYLSTSRNKIAATKPMVNE
jgi:hypothetical protein